MRDRQIRAVRTILLRSERRSHQTAVHNTYTTDIMKARKSIFWAFTAAEVLLIALALYGYFFAIFFALGAHALADRAIEKEEA